MTTSAVLLTAAIAVGWLSAPHAEAPVTLEDAIRLARAKAPRRAAAATMVDGARKAAPLAGRLPNPLIELRSENWTPGSSDDLSNDSFALLAQPIELGGDRGARRRVAEADLSLAEQSLAGLDRRLTLETVDRYLEAVRAREIFVLLSEQRTSAADSVRLMRRRVEEGYAAEADLRKFEAELARIDLHLMRARLDLDAAISRLGLLIGDARLSSGRLVEPPVPAPRLDDPALVARQAAERRPEAAALRAGVERARSQAALERARGVPDLLFSGGYKRTSGFDTGVVAIALPIPLSDRNGAAIARAEAEGRAAELELEALIGELTVDTEVALRTAMALAARAALVEADLITPATVVRQAARASFREGSSDILRLVDAERVWLEARRDALDLRLEATRAAIRARLALGEEVVP